MRHQCKRHKLSRPKDQREALLRSLATELFIHGEINTTLSKAKALKPYAENIITLAKRGDLNSRRRASKFIFDKQTGKYLNPENGEVFEVKEEGKKLVEETVLRRLFTSIGKKYEKTNGGYIRIYHKNPRRGDAVEMALIQLV